MRRPTLCSDRGDRLLSTICPDKQLCTVHMLQNLMHIINHFLEVQFSRRNTTQINLHYCIWHFDNMIIITINLCTEVHLSAQMLWITCQVGKKVGEYFSLTSLIVGLNNHSSLHSVVLSHTLHFLWEEVFPRQKISQRYGQSEINSGGKILMHFLTFYPLASGDVPPFAANSFRKTQNTKNRF